MSHAADAAVAADISTNLLWMYEKNEVESCIGRICKALCEGRVRFS